MTKRPTLYLIRHGQTEDNLAERMTGQHDSQLTSLGREQATRNGKILRGLVADPSAVDFVASTLSRAQATMEHVRAAFDPPPRFRTDLRLMEMHFGEWTGRPQDDASAFRAREHKRPGVDGWAWPWPGGESRKQLHDRVESFLAGLARDTVIVGHSGSVRMARGIALGLPRDEILSFYPANAGIIVIADSGEIQHGA